MPSVTKRPRAFEQLIRDIQSSLANPDVKNRDVMLVRSVLDLGFFRGQVRGDEDKVRGIIACARAIRCASGPGRVYAEQKMWDELESVACECRWQLEAANLPLLLGFSIQPTMSSETVSSLQVLGEIVDYALESIRFVRPRDVFSSRRRSMAFLILACAC